MSFHNRILVYKMSGVALLGAKIDLLKVCPYNPNHKVAPSKFIAHLYKCEQTSTIKLERCPYDSTHRIAKELMKAHFLECPAAQDELVRIYNNQKTVAAKKAEEEAEREKNEEVGELADRVEAIGLGNTKPKQSSESEFIDPSWDVKCVRNPYYLPGLATFKKNPRPAAYGGGAVLYQMLTPAEKRKHREKLVEKTFEKKSTRETAQIVEKCENALREKAEREKKEKAEKEKEKKEKAKAAKEKKETSTKKTRAEKGQKGDSQKPKTKTK